MGKHMSVVNEEETEDLEVRSRVERSYTETSYEIACITELNHSVTDILK